MPGRRGYGFDADRRRLRVVYDVGVRVKLSVRLVGLLMLGVSAGAEALLSRDRFVATRADGSIEELFRLSPVVGTLAPGLGVGSSGGR